VLWKLDLILSCVLWIKASRMYPRLYAPELSTTGRITLAGPEVHHAKDVLRIALGESVELFDGRGRIAAAAIAEIGRHEMVCDIVNCRIEPEPVPRVTLATAVPKGERFDWLVEKATELGIARLIPLQTERSSVDPRESKLARLRQTVVAACKQSRRAHLMELADVMPWQALLETCGTNLIVAHPSGTAVNELAGRLTTDPVFAVGPEGGFSAAELAQADAIGCRLVNLGLQPLRIETAAVVLAGWSALQRQTSEMRPFA
jgi:16S rRNA (uracil1498-N3)-methyltransferase